jgi:hypothetical protein
MNQYGPCLSRGLLMRKNILLLTPPFTQLNTPYPATPYLKGFLKLLGHEASQADLGIELITKIFSRAGFEKLFATVRKAGKKLSPNSERIIANEQAYLETVEPVMKFLRYQDDTLAPLISNGSYLPRASRFNQVPDLEWSFGTIGVNDKARLLSTLYIEDIGDLITDAVAPYFGFSRYAEKLGLSAHSFSVIEEALEQPDNLIEQWMLGLLKKHLDRHAPHVIGITVPFPGNFYTGLKCCRFIKKQAPWIKIVLGGGYVNTELRDLSEAALFKYVDFVTLDDGELPFLNILKFLEDGSPLKRLKRTFILQDGQVAYIDDARQSDPSASQTGTPDYSGLPLDDYLSLIEIANPMHRLWSDGRWNKLTAARGCYWHRCSFCDTTLPYIKNCSPTPARILVDRIEQVMKQTGRSGFHFVDEAAPPALLRDMALELLRRKISISWWANIRFEQAFTRDLCRLLAASGCIAATGGLEVAADRLLTLMNKGITVRQAARVCRNFSEAGIMVHAYLMYGFPTQTAQETVDSLETVRQFFAQGLIQSAFWHLFTVTVHSDIGRNPKKYKIKVGPLPDVAFARNDLVHQDPYGCDHAAFSAGLNKAVYNFMHGIGMDVPVRDWFAFDTPEPRVRPNMIARAMSGGEDFDGERMKARILWLGNMPEPVQGVQGRSSKQGMLFFQTRTERFTMTMDARTAKWLVKMLKKFSVQNRELPYLQDVKRDYEKNVSPSFESFLKSRAWKTLRERGLLVV